jgi:hypothetical protein
MQPRQTRQASQFKTHQDMHLKTDQQETKGQLKYPDICVKKITPF